MTQYASGNERWFIVWDNDEHGMWRINDAAATGRWFLTERHQDAKDLISLLNGLETFAKGGLQT